jgi:tetratricopeptide (TPR) repeat protein
VWGSWAGGDGSWMPLDRSVAVHLEDLRDFSVDGPRADLAGALTLELAARLTELEGLRVVLVGPVNGAGLVERPGYIVRGGLTRSDSVLRVTAMLVDGVSGATLDRLITERSLVGAPGVVEDLAVTMAHRIRRGIGRVVDDRERSATAGNGPALALVRTALRDMEASDSLSRAGASYTALHALREADSLLVQAQAASPRWAEPSVQRAEVALRRMWLSLLHPVGDRGAAGAAIREGLGHASAALALAADDPVALELRGALKYWQVLTGGSGVEARGALLAKAEADLRRATELDAGRGRAWSTLSALWESRGDFAAANLAARRAYHADVYRIDVQDILVRLFTTSLEVGDTGYATRWCGEIGRMQAGPWLHDYCRLELMAWEGLPRGLNADSVQALVREATNGPGGAAIRGRFEMLAAVVLARAGQREAALAALDRARSGSRGDPELGKLEAWAHLLLGDEDRAVELLAEAVAATPPDARGILASRRFASLRYDPRVQALAVAGPE